MTENRTPDLKIVSERSEHEILQAEIDRAFAVAAAEILKFLRGGSVLDVSVLRDFISTCAKYDETFGPNDGHSSIQFFDFNTGGEDEAINTILRGALQMIGALLLDRDTSSESYQSGLDELSRGVVKLNSKIRASRR